MFNTNRRHPILITSLVLAALITFIQDVELLLTDGSIMAPTATATSGSGGDDDGNSSNGNVNRYDNDGKPTEPTEPTKPTIAQRQFVSAVTTLTPPPPPSPTLPQIPTSTLTVGPTLIPTPTLTPAPTLTPPPRTVMTNFNDVNINNVQNLEGAVIGTPDCASIAASITLGPSTMGDGGARILASFNPCVLTDGTVLLNLPDQQGIQLVAANIQDGQTTQQVIIPLQRIAPIAQGQVLFGADLNEQVTGPDQARGDSATLNGNINALFLWNNSGQVVEFVGEHSVALNTFLRR